jgi:acylphosphatase
MSLGRRRYFFEGRVQGVGFRFTAERIAGNFPIAGYVRNLDDGRVEVVAEGDTTDLAEFVAAIRSVFGPKIRGVTELDEPSSDPPMYGFSVRY